MTPEERESVLLVATPRPWSHDEDGDVVGAEGQWVNWGATPESDVRAKADALLMLDAVNEYEAHLDGEQLLHGLLDYFRLYDTTREDGKTSPVIPKIEDVLARLDAARAA